ncbi:GNAT family N-acetyltransferase [Actinoplanes sp. TBRC 11911]|uniref:GNAT family N-acetyltransferase n=1 Tax=Actinoplanes sp. TBRC 11911 TaxID=2729386 RepID=UPI0028972687|nr:GNAT family N-acetyltransferase [Actinoplanes sp. TBRC 11911]
MNLLADVADDFAAAWQRRTGAIATIGRRTRLYRLETLISPVTPPHGKPRPAHPDDRALLIRWVSAFHHEIGERPGDIAAITDDRLASGGITLWEDDGEPVSMAIRSRPASAMIRVQIVYTPPELRGHGYAAGATFSATRAALATGVRDVVLNTDLANPTSNRLYSRLGYQPVEDRTVVEFSS